MTTDNLEALLDRLYMLDGNARRKAHPIDQQDLYYLRELGYEGKTPHSAQHFVETLLDERRK